jgi:pilus assembly protein CpaB
MKAARVVVLTIALGAGGIAALLAGRSEKPTQVKQAAAPKVETVDILVAKADIPTGKKISPQDVQWQPWPAVAATGNFIRKNNRPDAIEKMSGLIVRAPFVAGEPIREAKLVNAKGSGYMAAILPTGMRAVSTQISPETGAGGFILPNDHVDVILTQRDRAAEKATGSEVQTSQTILSNVRVLAIDQAVQEKNGQKVVVGKTATLELSPRQVETLTLAQHLGSLSLALRSITDAQRDKPMTDDNTERGRRNGGVNVIRFGVSTPTTVQ